MEGSYVVVMVMTASREEAEKISQRLLEERLIACANILGPVSSLFRWTGQIERADEYALLMKSRLDLFENLAKTVTTLHSYEVPEILALPILKGSAAYMDWVEECLR
jgi:periplasmic divalent cation tolerance protein